MLRLVAAISFLGFGLWTLIASDDDEEEEARKGLSPLWTVALAFFVGELGDKTQLTAITLATASTYPIFTLLGTVSGMVLTSSVGIFIGTKLGDRIPDLAIKLASSAVFTVFGLVALYDVVPGEYLSLPTVAVALSIILGANILLMRRTIRQHRLQGISPLRQAAREIKARAELVRGAVSEVCLGSKACGGCESTDCLIGYAKAALDAVASDGARGFAGDLPLPKDFDKPFERKKVGQALQIAAMECFNCRGNHLPSCAFHRARQALELIYFGEILPFDGNQAKYLALLRKKDRPLAEALEQRVSA